MALNKDKTDSVLGWEVHDHLRSIGIETPMNSNVTDMMDKQKLSLLEEHFEKIMDLLGLDLMDDSMQDSPRRLAKMYVNELFWGMDYKNFPKCTAIENKLQNISTNNSFVLEKGITVNSVCEHHFVPIYGKCTIAYLPKGKMLGLSKLNRVTEAVFIDSEHFCVKSRGIQDTNSSTVTLSVGGVFAQDKSDIRREFLNLARMQ